MYRLTQLHWKFPQSLCPEARCSECQYQRCEDKRTTTASLSRHHLDTCNGSITKWIVGGTTNDGQNRMPELQIWRNTGGSDYSYTKANFSILSSSTPDSNNIVEHILNTPLEFLEGDILGVYQPQDCALVVYYQERDGPVKYRQGSSAQSTVTLDTPHNQYDYPLVSVEINTGKLMPYNVQYNDCTFIYMQKLIIYSIYDIQHVYKPFL